MLADRELDFPFCLCWANENWSRRWDGSEQEILMEQKHLPEDAGALHARHRCRSSQDPRYIRVDGAPVLLVYRPAIIPDLTGVVQHLARRPQRRVRHSAAASVRGAELRLRDRASGRLRRHGRVSAARHRRRRDHRQDAGVSPEFTGKIYRTPRSIRYSLKLGLGIGLPVYRGVMTGLGQHGAPRRSEPHLSRRHARALRGLARPSHRLHAAAHHGDHRLVFVNAWNEWAEGAYLEPDEKYRYGFLEATARAVFGVPDPSILIQALRQITDGNEEAKGLLDQLDHGLRVNAQIAALIEARKWSAPVVVARRLPRAVPAARRVRRQAALDDRLRRRRRLPRRAQHAELRARGGAPPRLRLFLSGWLASKQIRGGRRLAHRVSAHEPRLQRPIHRDGAVTRAPRRCGGPLKRTAARFRQIAEACSLYSGYRAHLNIAAVEPGSYSLEAIVPSRDGTRGIVVTLRSSIMIV